MENKISTILEGLNEEQEKAVRCIGGPVLIVAGAGSGKTRVLTSRIAYILGSGCPPERILALTFTKKAANEMKERIAGMVGERPARKLYMGTFHSVFIRFLREFAESLGYRKDFTIYDTGDSISAVRTCLKELQLDEKIYKPKDVLSRISMAKNNLTTAAAYSRNAAAIQNDTAAKKPRIHEIYRLYSQKCLQSNVMDFDDILLNMNILLRDNPEALESVSGRFSYIMVDEYQDTNFSQYLILKKLSADHRNICVVGDDSQSIYAFRGAKIENILNFKKDYPECNVFRLERNYRSTRTIVDAANSLIARNSARIPKKCWSGGEVGDKIKLISAYTEQEEAILVVSEIVSRIHSESAAYKDFAILYRTNSQSRALEEALRRRNLPYRIYSGNSFFDRMEVKDLMAYFKLASNTDDDESFKRIVNKPARGIGNTSLAALSAAAMDKGVTLFRAAFADDLENYGLKAAAVEKIRAFCGQIAGFSLRIPKDEAGELAVSIAVESGILGLYKSDTSIEGQSKTANIEELINSVKTFVEEKKNEYFEEMLADSAEDVEISAGDLPTVTLGDFLENVSLLSAVDMEDDEDSDNKVTLMTVHSSKGLEFPYVFVVGLEENLFPSGGSLASENEIEEERRLFYVAMTRAEKAVWLSFASTRMRNGKHESNYPSRFIREIDRKYILNPLETQSGDDSEQSGYAGMRQQYRSQESRPVFRTQQPRNAGPVRTEVPRTSGVTPFRKPAQVVKPRADYDFVPSPVMQLAPGQRIEHNRFGYGIIREITGDAAGKKARIAFDEYGEKILMLNYAKIRIISIDGK
ncbi:MAG TPA: UvrD-helicase domain-containing protein [Candidatus Cryptobacteroides intestinipullorum]|nr:UvrD-helicase domain-containing protein [Candidatus Cryptobacteroides intestinipullorum]